MKLTVAGTSIDVTTRALVLGVADSATKADLLRDAGADVVEINGEVEGLTVVTGDGDDVAAVRDSLVEQARALEAAGVESCSIVLEPGRSHELLQAMRLFACLGYPVLASPATMAEAAVAVTLGCRIIRTTDVAGARQLCDVVAAILEAD